MTCILPKDFSTQRACNAFVAVSSLFVTLHCQAYVSQIDIQDRPEKYIEAVAGSADAERLFFQMMHAVSPLCESDSTKFAWSFGPRRTTFVEPKTKVDDEARSESSTQANFRAGNQVIAKHYGLNVGESVFTAEVKGTPWEFAGFSTGKAVVFPDSLSNELKVLNFPRNDSDDVRNVDTEIRRSPVIELPILKGGSVVQVKIRRVPVCAGALDIRVSEFKYADSVNRSVTISYPLLKTLAREELVSVMALEVARVALGQTDGLARLGAATFFPGLLAPLINIETKTIEPPPKELIAADRLAMQIASGFGVEVPTYISVIRKLVEEPAPMLGAPYYRKTRGIAYQREEAFTASEKAWQEKKFYLLVAGVDLQTQRQIRALSRVVHTRPDSIFSALEPVKTAKASGGQGSTDMKETASGASVDTVDGLNGLFRSQYRAVEAVKTSNLDAIPTLSAVCRERYVEWLARPLPKGFAISSLGSCGLSWGTKPAVVSLPTDPGERALLLCNRLAKGECQLYALDDQVVQKQ